MKYIVRILFILTTLSLAPPLLLHGAENSRAIRIGISERPPFCSTDSTGKAQGLYPDLITKIAVREHWTVTFVPGTWTEGLNRLLRGEIDLIPHIGYSPERNRVMSFSHESVFDEWGQVFLKPGNPIETIADLDGMRIAVPEHDINGKHFIKTTEAIGITCDILTLPTNEDVFRAVQQGTVAAGVTSQHFGLRNARNFKLVASPIQFAPFSLFFAAKKGLHTDKLAVIDGYMHRWKRVYNSYYHERLSHWMGANAAYEKEIIPPWLLSAIAAIVGISALLVILNRALNKTVKKRTLELHTRKKQYKDLVESANSIILRMDKYGRVLFLNKFGLDLFGYTREEIYGHNVLGTILTPEEARTHHFSTTHEELFKMPGHYALIENENICKDGHPVYIQWSNRAITDDWGHFQEILSIGTDITQRRQLETSLYQAQKMEAIGTLAGGIAHDFNNILSVIFGYTELAQLYIGDPDKIRKALEQITQGSQRAKELVSQILTFSRKSQSEKQLLQPLLIAKETVKLLRPTLPSTIQIKSDLASKSTIKADPTQIHQVIMNLCTNAYHAMENTGGTLRVALTDCHIEKAESITPASPQTPGDYILLEVSDTGSGIEPKIMQKIFDPYFTTKEPGKGTGLGLSVVQGIVKENRGHIHIQSLPGKGTTFYVYLPIQKSEARRASEAPVQKQVTGGNEILFVVDDEKKITESLSEILSQHGYTVRTFANGLTALTAFKKAPDAVDLVLTDLTMPGMTGNELAQNLLALRPELPVILGSGYSELMTLENSQKIGIAECLQKPIIISDLLDKIRKHLDGREPR
ncbi:ATP-binding protein [Desulfoluna sp.]|uniref:ATP-binding protein n=1 Tax=Desulfoluna sp. TaxID=2045199 RepID=UPI00260ABFC0|nr:ATP-binding protein [Desulfoluna sp.]